LQSSPARSVRDHTSSLYTVSLHISIEALI
jgi:hypothetical protein